MPSSAKVLHILIAEAEPWTADLLLQLVRDVRPDARIHLASDGEAALAQCQKRWPALVIADGELPVVDGLELLRQLRRMPRGHWPQLRTWPNPSMRKNCGSVCRHCLAVLTPPTAHPHCQP